MGCGKSLVSRELSQQIAWSFIDLDDQIEELMDMTIRQIFEVYGESRFREIESEELKKLLSIPDKQVVALGGGTYCQPALNSLINNTEDVFTVYLKYAPEMLVERLKTEKDHRPILKEAQDLKSFISKHLVERERFYEKAELVIADETSVEKIKDQIVAYLSYRNQS